MESILGNRRMERDRGNLQHDLEGIHFFIPKEKTMANRTYWEKQTFQTVQGEHASHMKQPQMWPVFQPLPGV